jgi:hypothetical protein
VNRRRLVALIAAALSVGFIAVGPVAVAKSPKMHPAKPPHAATTTTTKPKLKPSTTTTTKPKPKPKPSTTTTTTFSTTTTTTAPAVRVDRVGSMRTDPNSDGQCHDQGVIAAFVHVASPDVDLTHRLTLSDGGKVNVVFGGTDPCPNRVNPVGADGTAQVVFNEPMDNHPALTVLFDGVTAPGNSSLPAMGAYGAKVDHYDRCFAIGDGHWFERTDTCVTVLYDDTGYTHPSLRKTDTDSASVLGEFRLDGWPDPPIEAYTPDRDGAVTEGRGLVVIRFGAAYDPAVRPTPRFDGRVVPGSESARLGDTHVESCADSSPRCG